jgi:hypothetical protein
MREEMGDESQYIHNKRSVNRYLIGLLTVLVSILQNTRIVLLRITESWLMIEGQRVDRLLVLFA